MRRLTAVTIGDRPAAWEALGFTVASDRFTVGGVTVHLVGDAGERGLRSWTLDPPVHGDTDGLAHAPAPPRVEEAAHRNGVTAVDHLVVGTPHVDRTTAALDSVGLEPRRTIEGIREGSSTYRFFLLQTCVLELIGPTRHDPSRMPRPAAFVGIAFVAPTLEPICRMDGVAGEARDAIQPGRRIVTLRTAEHEVSVPVAVLTPRRQP